VRLRIVTYNVRSCRGGVDLVADVLQSASPDIVCLQEYGRTRTLRRLTRRLGMEAASSWRPLNRLRNAVLYRIPWELAAVVRSTLPAEHGVRRGVLVVDLRAHDVALTVASTHLSLRAGERRAQASAVAELLDRDGPLILAGDLNEDPSGVAVRTLNHRMHDVFARAGDGPGETLPAERPTARIDYLFTSAHIIPERAWVPASAEVLRASDHRPVIADLRVLDA
jgi:endonuclease/exonuclease/phosphatase family metal-dependent hydrolase